MRRVDGFILLARRHLHIYLFGSGAASNRESSPLCMNGIQPFASIHEALLAKQSMARTTHYDSIEVKNLQMNIAETPDDEAALKRNHSLVVIQLHEDDANHQLIYGRPVHGCTKLFDCVNAIGNNELLGFRSYAGALDAKFQIMQRTQFEARIASFNIR